VGALVVVGGVIAALVFLVGGGDDDKKNVGQSSSPTTSATSTSSSSASASPTETETTSSSRPTSTRSTSTRTATSTATRTPTAFTTGDTVDDISVSVGECLNLETSGKLTRVSCTTAHDLQVLKNFDLTGTSYPSEAEIQEQVDDACYSTFQSLVSGEPDPSAYKFIYRFPLAGKWSYDREVTCFVTRVDNGKISGKLG